MAKWAVGIAGTDTDAGKTVVTAALARAAHDAGLGVLVLKPVQTGCCVHEGRRQAPDRAVYTDACSNIEARALWLFEAACSPHLAARMEGKTLTAQAVAESVREAVRTSSADLVLLEGAGGLLTPLNERETLADVYALLGWSCLLVVGNRLGAVNHALLSLEVSSGRGITMLGYVMNDCAGTATVADTLSTTIAADNGAIIASLGPGWGGAACLAEIGHEPALQSPSAEHREQAWKCLAAQLVPLLSTIRAAAGIGESLLNETDTAFDREHLWHPYTSAVQPLTVRKAVSTRGALIRLEDGRELVDGMASWWCAIHGYRHPVLMAALREQAAVMPHVMFGGLTHQPAIELGKKLLAMCPEGLGHVFFADSGSVAVEVALKMALQYQQAAGQGGRTRFLTVRGGYHGDTLGAMGVCDPENGMHSLFKGFVGQHFFAPRPVCRFDEPYDPRSIEAFTQLLGEHAGSIAAVILEPIVQGAGGMWMYHPQYLRAVSALCREHGCLLILDEIATGFGRTGKLFACEHAGISPDILCVGKGLTGGVMTLAATLATQAVAEGISCNGGVLMHGPTFMANPLACAVAAASLDLLADGTWQHTVLAMERVLRAGLEPCRAMPGVRDVRVLGGIGVVEMEGPINVERAQQYFIERHNVWIRPFGHLMYVMPPYVCSKAELERLAHALCAAVEERQWN